MFQNLNVSQPSNKLSVWLLTPVSRLVYLWLFHVMAWHANHAAAVLAELQDLRYNEPV